MTLIGRKKEQDALDMCLRSGRPEFVAIYGRRRIGKTFLVREYFKNEFSFYSTGVAGGKTREQLKAFGASLIRFGSQQRTVPRDWFEAFSRLQDLLDRDDVSRDRASGRITVFLDELPWFDTARSDFKAALEFFWNGWASARRDVMLIVCGSATSWIIGNLIDDRGGFHNRVTRQIHLVPFTLSECEEFYHVNGIAFTRQQVVESYMIFGGVPHYLNLIDRRSSLAQNVNQLCFDESGQLRHELDRLLSSLFKHSERHAAIVGKLAKRRGGFTRAELSGVEGIGGGQPLTTALNELEQCGFVRRYRDFSKKERGQHFQLIDPFTLFSLRFVKGHEFESWLEYINSPGYYAWRGMAFELVCLLHVPQIKAALGITGVASSESAWRGAGATSGAQVDLVIDRADGIVNLCEMKFSDRELAIDKALDAELRSKAEAFSCETGTRKAVHITMVTSSGLVQNRYRESVQNELTVDDLFA